MICLSVMVACVRLPQLFVENGNVFLRGRQPRPLISIHFIPCRLESQPEQHFISISSSLRHAVVNMSTEPHVIEMFEADWAA